VSHRHRRGCGAALPAELEVDEHPLVTVLFVSYGFCSVGPFREYIHTIRVRFRGEDIAYVPHISITNEMGVLAGREREGLPKLLADIDFDAGRSDARYAYVSRTCCALGAKGTPRPSRPTSDKHCHSFHLSRRGCCKSTATRQPTRAHYPTGLLT
jgi:hypothetical protein